MRTNSEDSRTFMWRFPLYGGVQEVGLWVWDRENSQKTLYQTFFWLTTEGGRNPGWLVMLIFSVIPPGTIGVSFVIFLARGMWLGTWDRGGGSTSSPSFTDFKRGGWWGHRRQGSQMGAEFLELSGHQVPEEGEEEMVLSHRPSQSSTGIFCIPALYYSSSKISDSLCFAESLRARYTERSGLLLI